MKWIQARTYSDGTQATSSVDAAAIVAREAERDYTGRLQRYPVDFEAPDATKTEL